MSVLVNTFLMPVNSAVGGQMCSVPQWLLWLWADIWVLFGSPSRDGSPSLISSWYSTHASDPFLSDWNISRWKALSFNFLFYPGVELINNVVLVSVQFGLSVVSNSLRPHGLQHARPPCPSPTPGVHSNSCPSSQWCHPAILSPVIPFSSHLQSSQHQGLFKSVSSPPQGAKVLEFQLQHQSFQWIFTTNFL